MNIDVWVVYVGVVMAFMITPGPSHLLMLSNSLSCGFNKSVATAAGDLSANVLQMLAASIGLASILYEYQHSFIVIKWAGVVYLIYLGIGLFFTKENRVGARIKSTRSIKSLYWQGFITSASNPKAIIFFSALFPQFIIATEPLFTQFVLLCITYLIIDGAFLCFYGKFADWVAKKMQSSIGKYFNQLSGILFVSAAVLLGIKDLEKN